MDQKTHLVIAAMLGLLLMEDRTALALTVTSARVSFGAPRGPDFMTIRGYIDSPPEFIDQFPTLRIDIGAFSETIPTALFTRVIRTDGSMPRAYRYRMPRERKHRRDPGVNSLYLDFETGLFYARVRYVPLGRSQNPLPFRVAFGSSDVCIMLPFAETPATTGIYEYDPETGFAIPGSRQTVIDGSRHAKWTFLRDAPQVRCQLKDLVARPSGFTVNEPARVVVSARVPNQAVTGLQVFEVDHGLAIVSGPLCDLRDDGQNGDDVTGDRVRSCRIDFFERDPRTIRLIARGFLNGQEVLSPKIQIDVVSQLLEEDAAVFIENLYRARDIWGEKLATLGNTQQARDQTAAAILALPHVRDIAANEDSFLMEFAVGRDDGVLAYLPATGTEARQGPIPQGTSSPLPPEPPAMSPVQFDYAPNLSTFLVQASTRPADTRVQNTRVLFWTPTQASLPPALEQLRERFSTNACPDFRVRVEAGQDCTLQSVHRFDDFGTVIIVGEGRRPSRHELRNSKLADRSPHFATAQQVNGARLVFEWADAAVRWWAGRPGVPGIPERTTPRLIMHKSETNGVVWGVRPEYITEQLGRFPSSVIFAGFGDSTNDFAMAGAFNAAGAASFLGFDGRVTPAFVSETAAATFDRVLGGQTVAEAYAELAGVTDPAEGGRFELLGDGRPHYAALYDVLNGDFETGTLSSWTAAGDGRAVSRLGPYGPTEGAFMGLVSTGLGATVERGIIEQAACVPAGKRWLRFDWNMLSEEFRNYCSTGFNDTFEVHVDGLKVFEQTVNALCTGPLSPVPGLRFDANDDVFATGWRSGSVDLHPFLGGNEGTVDVRFAVGDVLDQGFDTVILLDRIRFE